MKLCDCEIPHQPKKAGLTNNITVTTQGDCIFTSVTDPSGCLGNCVPAFGNHRHNLALQEVKPMDQKKTEASTGLPQNAPPQSYLSAIY